MNKIKDKFSSIPDRSRRWCLRHPEKRRAMKESWNIRHPEKLKAMNRKQNARPERKVRKRIQNRKSYLKNKNRTLPISEERWKKSRKKARDESILLLGDKCSNPECPIPKEKMDYRCLQIDHVHGGGKKESKKLGGSLYFTIRRKIKEGSKDYQVLCVYCNWKKRYDRGE